MSSGSGRSASNPSTVLIGTLQEMQVRLRRIENKQSQMQSCLEELKEMVKVNQEASFKIIVHATMESPCLPISCDQCPTVLQL